MKFAGHNARSMTKGYRKAFYEEIRRSMRKIKVKCLWCGRMFMSSVWELEMACHRRPCQLVGEFRTNLHITMRRALLEESRKLHAKLTRRGK